MSLINAPSPHTSRHTDTGAVMRQVVYATLPGRRQPTFASSGGRACLALMSDAYAPDRLLTSPGP
mgnify:CR=1 FL=1